MTITFPCPACGKQYKAKPEQAGKKIKCKDCGTVVPIPVPRGQSAQSGTQTGPALRSQSGSSVRYSGASAPPKPQRGDVEEVACPSCQAPCRILPQWRGQTLECPSCKRRFVVPHKGAAPARVAADAQFFSEDDGGPEYNFTDEGESNLDDSLPPREEAAPAIPTRKKKKPAALGNWSLGGGMPKVAAGVAVVALIGLAAVSSVGSILLLMIGAVTLLVGYIWMLVTPFRESVVCGIMWLFVPFYALYYLCSRWEDTWRPFTTYLAGWGLVALSIALNPEIRQELNSDDPFQQPGVAQGQFPGQGGAPGFQPAVPGAPNVASPFPGQPAFGPGIPESPAAPGSAASGSSPVRPSPTSPPSRQEPSNPEQRRDQLSKDLESSSFATRRDAAQALAKMKPDENQSAVARQLESVLQDNDKSLVEFALDALAAWGDKDSATPVKQVLRSTPWPTTKAKALAILVKFPDDDLVDVVADSVGDLKGSDGDVRTMLEQMGPSGEKTAIKILTGSKAWVFTKRDVAKFVETFSKKHALSPESVAALLDVVRDDRDHDTVRPLIAALATVKEERVADFLATGLDDFWYAKEAKTALIAMGPAAEKSVAKYLKHQKPEVRFTCCEILLVIGTKKSVSALRPLVANNPVGQAAKDAIDAINQRAKSEN